MKALGAIENCEFRAGPAGLATGAPSFSLPIESQRICLDLFHKSVLEKRENDNETSDFLYWKNTLFPKHRAKPSLHWLLKKTFLG